MKRRNFLKTAGVIGLAPSVLMSRINMPTSIEKESGVSPVGITDILKKLNLYEPTTKGTVTSFGGSRNGILTKYENNIQIFREQLYNSNNIKGISETFKRHKYYVDIAMLHSDKTVTYIAGKNDNVIQTMGGLDYYCNTYGTILSSDLYNIKLFDELSETLTSTKAPKMQLLVSKREAYNKIMAGLRNLGSSGVHSYENDPLCCQIFYGMYNFIIAPIDNCLYNHSYLMPLGLIKTPDGKDKNMVSGRHIDYTFTKNKRDNIWCEFNTTKGTEFVTGQCIEVVSPEHLIKIKHHS
jgi:hypothetical protein